MNLFTSLYTTNDAGLVKERIDNVKSKLQLITTMIHDLSKKSDNSEMIADIIESELAGMDKAIEAAAAQIEVTLSKKSHYYYLQKRINDYN